MSRLKRMHRFILDSEEDAMCCLVHGHGLSGEVVLLGYFMMRFGWRLSKSLDYLRFRNLRVDLMEGERVAL